VIGRVGDPVDPASGKDHFAWDTGFKQVYEAKAEEASRDVLADLSGARLLTDARPALLGSRDEVAS